MLAGLPIHREAWTNPVLELPAKDQERLREAGDGLVQLFAELGLERYQAEIKREDGSVHVLDWRPLSEWSTTASAAERAKSAG